MDRKQTKKQPPKINGLIAFIRYKVGNYALSILRRMGYDLGDDIENERRI